jgi:hypothetical protein
MQYHIQKGAYEIILIHDKVAFQAVIICELTKQKGV